MTQQQQAVRLWNADGFKHVVDPSTLPRGFLNWLYDLKNIPAMEVVTGQLAEGRLAQLIGYYESVVQPRRPRRAA